MRMNPETQLTICNDERECYTGDYPTLTTLKAKYRNDKAPVLWLVPQLADLSEFAGSSNKLQDKQLKECAAIIANRYGYLKVSELMLFFYKFKDAERLKFYGAVDPMTIIGALSEFVARDRAAAISKAEQEEREREMEEHAWHVVYSDEWRAIRRSLNADQRQRLANSRWAEYRYARETSTTEEEIVGKLVKRGFNPAMIEKAKKCAEYVERQKAKV